MAEKEKDPLKRDLNKARDFAKGFLGGSAPKTATQTSIPEKKSNLQYDNKKQRNWGSSW